ncbi:hypothetical protein GXW82_23175 [Streptacidiphilus sp. 4-A2]|nr:hypothetical protein [Streptacidiphilus sp. 4-A2]
MNAVARQRRTNARRIAEVCPAAPVPLEALPGALPAAPREPARTAPQPVLAVAAQDRADALSGSPVAIDLLAADDTGACAAAATVVLAGQPRHGRVVLGEDATAVYTSAPGFTGTDVFCYRLADGRGRVLRVTVTVTVAPPAGPASAAAALAYAA